MNKRNKCIKLITIIIGVICFFIFTSSVYAGDGTREYPLDPKDVWFTIDKPVANFSLLVTDTYTGLVKEFNPYVGGNLTVNGESLRQLYVRVGRDKVQMKNLSTCTGNPISLLDMQIHSANYIGGIDLRLIPYQNFLYGSAQDINIPGSGEYNVYLNASGTHTDPYYNSTNGQHRATVLKEDGLYHYWYFVQMRIVAVDEPQQPIAIISDNTTGNSITNINVKEGIILGLSAEKSNFYGKPDDKYYTWEIKNDNTPTWTVLSCNLKNNPILNLPSQQIGRYKIRLTISYCPYESIGNSQFDYWSYNRISLYNSTQIDLIVTPANLKVNLTISCSPVESKLTQLQISNNELKTISVSASANIIGLNGSDTLIDKWTLWFRKDSPIDNNLQTQSVSDYYVPGVFAPLKCEYSGIKSFTVPSSWAQNSGVYTEKFCARAQVIICGILYESDLVICSSKFIRDGITISATLTPTIAEAGQEITITINTTNFVDVLEVVFPMEIYSLDPNLKNSLGKINKIVTPKVSSTEIIKYNLPINILKTINEKGSILRLPYSIIINARKNDGSTASTNVELNVKGSITDGLMTRRR